MRSEAHPLRPASGLEPGAALGLGAKPVQETRWHPFVHDYNYPKHHRHNIRWREIMISLVYICPPSSMVTGGLSTNSRQTAEWRCRDAHTSWGGCIPFDRAMAPTRALSTDRPGRARASSRRSSAFCRSGTGPPGSRMSAWAMYSGSGLTARPSRWPGSRYRRSILRLWAASSLR